MTKTNLACMVCPNLVVLPSMASVLWHGEAQNGVNLGFQVKFHLPKKKKKKKKNNIKKHNDLNQIVLHLMSTFGGASFNV